MLKERELRYVLADSGAKAVISLQDRWHATAAQAVAGTEVTVAITTSPLDYLAGEATPPPVLADVARTATPGAADLAELLREHAGERPGPVTLGPGDIALLTYTSGTTGDPKGAMNTHGNVAFNACTFRDWMSLTPRDVVLGGAPLFHITGLIAHIAVGMLVPMPIVLGYRFEPATVIRLAELHRCTFTVIAITAFTALANDPAAAAADLSSLTSGYKVWPREVEDTLLRHPAVREAAVVGVPDAYRGETVWAYVSLRPGTTATPEELIGFCRAELAAYKYPRRVEVLGDLPKTPTGKLLRRELRERAIDG
jgi:acyl-CoA synthetase (AMP-forming)/AMP-acid ligase II